MEYPYFYYFSITTIIFVADMVSIFAIIAAHIKSALRALQGTQFENRTSNGCCNQICSLHLPIRLKVICGTQNNKVCSIITIVSL